MKGINVLLAAVLFGGATQASATAPRWFISRGLPGVSLGNAQPQATFFDPSGVTCRTLNIGPTVGPFGIELLSSNRRWAAKDGGSYQGRQQLIKPISYRTVAIPVSQALSDLSKVSGTKLMADGDLGEERIILRLDAVPVRLVMDKIADVCSAEWKPVDGGFELFRSPATVGKLQKADLDRRVSHLTGSIQRLVSEAKTEGRMTKDEADKMAQYFIKSNDLLNTGTRPPHDREAAAGIRRHMAETRLLAQILAGMDPAELASLTPGFRYVYTTKPNAVQRQLPPLDEATLRAYVDDQNLVSDAVNDQILKVKGQVSRDVTENYPQIDDLNLKVYVVFQAWPGVYTCQVDLYVNSRTNNVGRADELLANPLQPKDYLSQQADGRSKSNFSGLEVSPQLKPLLLRSESVSPAAVLPPLDPALRSALLKPTEHDPLLFTSDCVLKVADAEGVNVALVPCDACESMVMYAAGKGKFTRELLETEMTQYGGEDCSAQDGWFTGKPASPLRADSQRCPRDAMERYLQAIDEQGFASIEDQVGLVLACAYGTSDGLPLLSRGEIWGSQGDFGNSSSETALRLYGSLTEEQKTAAKAGLSLTYAQLTPDQQGRLAWFVYGTPFTYFYALPDPKTPASAQSIELEKTDWTPDGLQPGDTLEIKENVDNVAFYSVSYNGQPGYSGSGTIDDAAREVAAAEKSSPGRFQTTIDNMRIGTRRQIVIKVTVPGKCWIGGSIDENRGANVKGVTPDKLADTLSSDLRDQYLAALSRYRAQFKNTTFLGPEEPSSTPPPR